MEKNKNYKELQAHITSLENELKYVHDIGQIEDCSEVRAEIEDHFAKCIRALEARRNELIGIIVDHYNQRTMKIEQRQATLNKAIYKSSEMLRVGLLCYEDDACTADFIWEKAQTVLTFDMDEISTKMQVSLSSDLLDSIRDHGKVGMKRSIISNNSPSKSILIASISSSSNPDPKSNSNQQSNPKLNPIPKSNSNCNSSSDSDSDFDSDFDYQSTDNSNSTSNSKSSPSSNLSSTPANPSSNPSSTSANPSSKPSSKSTSIPSSIPCSIPSSISSSIPSTPLSNPSSKSFLNPSSTSSTTPSDPSSKFFYNPPSNLPLNLPPNLPPNSPSNPRPNLPPLPNPPSNPPSDPPSNPPSNLPSNPLSTSSLSPSRALPVRRNNIQYIHISLLHIFDSILGSEIFSRLPSRGDESKDIFFSSFDQRLYVCGSYEIYRFDIHGKGKREESIELGNEILVPGPVVTYDKDKIVFLTDGLENRVIKFTPRKEYIRLEHPKHIVVDQQTGNAFVSDWDNCIWTVTLEGKITSLVKNCIKKTDYRGLFFDEVTKHLLVCDYSRDCIKAVTPDGKISILCKVPTPMRVAITASRAILVTSQDRCVYIITQQASGDYKAEVLAKEDAWSFEPTGITVHNESKTCFVVGGGYIWRISFAD